jgi:hypothetical protein
MGGTARWGFAAIGGQECRKGDSRFGPASVRVLVRSSEFGLAEAGVHRATAFP